MKVSVIVTTYNHEKYIAQCLATVLSQKGNFEMEIIVGDDCSTDNTRSIVHEFMNKNPNMVAIDFPERNIGVTKNLQRCLGACTGDYIAICEGDDYWIDENKIQKQVDFLETNQDCSMCFTAIMLVYEETNTIIPHPDQEKLTEKFITADELIDCNYIGNFSCCMYRANVVHKLPEGIFNLYTVDWFFNISCAEFGKIGFIHEHLSVYRLHEKGAWTGKNQLVKMKELSHNIDLYNELLNFRHDASFSKLKKGVDEDINRLELLENSEIIRDSIGAGSSKYPIGKIKKVINSIVRKYD